MTLTVYHTIHNAQWNESNDSTLSFMKLNYGGVNVRISASISNDDTKTSYLICNVTAYNNEINKTVLLLRKGN